MACITITNVSAFLEEHDDSKRNLVHVVRMWDEMRGEKKFPSENDICPSAVGELWDDCFVIQQRDIRQPNSGNYTYLGDNIIAAYEMGFLNHAEGKLIAPKNLSVNGRFAQVLENGNAIYEEDEIHDGHGATIKFRQCFLPLATHGEQVDAIFGCMHYKVDGKTIAHARYSA